MRRSARNWATRGLELHSPCTVGLAPITYTVAADLVDVRQVALGPLSNGSSLPDAGRVVANLRELGHTVDVDDRLLDTALSGQETVPPESPELSQG